jgi:poly(3-hydroxybutyrate) depolymerase
VFDRPAVATASASGSAKPVRLSKPARSAAEVVEAPPALVRPGIAEPCAEAGGSPVEADRRPAGRPACRRARVLEHREAGGAPRYACVSTPDNADERAPLPLVIFLHDEYDDPTAVSKKTRLRTLVDDFDLTGEPRRRGFVLLAPQARRIQGKLRFASEHRARDNADVVAIDRFVDGLVAERLVDKRQIYAIGASAGGEMAALYAMLRADRVAAFGVYGAAPRDLRWSCSAEPPPAMAIYRSCDAVTPCADVEQWLSVRDRERGTTQPLRLGAANQTEPSCVTSRHLCSVKRGTADHARWPKERERELLEYLGRFHLE